MWGDCMKLLKRMKKQVALVSALAMAFGMQVTTMASDYSGHWAAEVITEWNEYGVINGYQDGTFKPNNSMTRAEFAVVLSNVFGLVELDQSITFADVNTTAWYNDAINKVAAAGVMQGADGKFNPSATITRQEVAVALVNAYNLTEKGSQIVNFTDAASIASWAKEQVELMASNGYISGRVDGKFDPKANITRAEVLKMLDNMTAGLFNKAGTYTQDVNGNVIISTPNVILKDMTIKGDLYLAQGINLGHITLENVTVEGRIIVAGGGANSINFKGSTANQIIVLESSKDKVELKLDSTSKVRELVANSVVNITGNGKIDKIVASVEGITSTIKPSSEPNKSTKPVTYIGTSTGGGGGSSSGGSGGSGGGGGNTNPPSKPETPVEEYIGIESIIVDGSSENLLQYITIDKAHVSANLEDLEQLRNLGEAETVTVKFTNLKEGDKINIKVVAGAVTKQKSITVGENGTLTTSVSALRNAFYNNKDRIINKLNELGVYNQVKLVLDKLGLDINGDYAADGSVDMNKVVDKAQEAWNLYVKYMTGKIKDEGHVEAIDTLRDILIENGFELNADSIGFVGIEDNGYGHQWKISVQAGNLKETNYTFRIQG